MRVLIPPGTGEPGKLVGLDEKEIHHLRVRRAREHQSVELLDGAGFRGTGRLVQTGRHWMVEIQSGDYEPRPAELVLAVAAGDRDRFTWMVEKAVELGVTRIVPLETARCSGVATGIRGSHLPRLRRHALEATKQCGIPWALEVEQPLSLEAFLAEPLAGTGWLADQSGRPPLLPGPGNALTVVIGPEGGFEAAERSALAAAGYHPTVLSRHTLRFETAALAAAALAAMARMRGDHG